MVENQASQTFVLVSRSQSANLCQNCATFEQSQNSKTQLDIQLTDKRLEARLKKSYKIIESYLIIFKSNTQICLVWLKNFEM